jgi:K+-transporting ATPase ATPase C chain
MKILRQCMLVFLALAVLTGAVYPLAITLFGQLVFPHQANGSLIERNGKVVGSELIGQSFADPRYFWSRPSAAGYNGGASTGSNLGPTNPAQLDAVKQRVADLKGANNDNETTVPIDLVTASASGLDPHISPAGADFQVSRVAKARNLDERKVSELVASHTESRALGLLGEPRVNVLKLNLALDDVNP